MYRYLDKLLAAQKKKVRTEFNRIDVMGFDELNVTGVRKVTQAMFERLLRQNEALYLKAAKDSYKKAASAAKKEPPPEKEKEVDASWIGGVLAAFCLVTGYLYDKEAERERLRLNEQILTAREYGDRQMHHDSLRRAANLWWTQTSQYGIEIVDGATLKAYEDVGVKRVRWSATIDKRTCPVCRERDGTIYDIAKVPRKTHYNCRCRLEPVTEE